MHIRALAVGSLFTLFPFAIVGSAREAAAQGRAAPRRPNVLLIVVDDLGYGDLGCYGSKEIRTPSIDRLAGRAFGSPISTRATPICSPTRASLLTGRYPQHRVRVGRRLRRARVPPGGQTDPGADARPDRGMRPDCSVSGTSGTTRSSTRW